jgi:hypothetical protein
MGCTEAFATVPEFLAFSCGGNCAEEEVANDVQVILTLAAADIHAAMAAADMCGCTLAGWAGMFLKRLNIVIALISYDLPCCSSPSDDMKRAYLEWSTKQVENIRTGKTELCAGHTGADYPAIGWATPVATEFTGAEVVGGDIVKTGDYDDV